MKLKPEMTILSIVCTKLLGTNAHLGRRVADHHFKVYIRGSRNGIAILDSDKTLICLRNALHFIGSPSRQKGRSFFLKTNHLFDLEIMEEMASYFRSYLRNVNSHCFDDSQWKIGAFLTHSFANKKKFRSRKKKIHFGLNQQPHCVLILNADRKSSVILEADRSQIPIASLGYSTIPWQSQKRLTYTIPSSDGKELVFLFCHSIMKTVIIEQKAIQVETPEINVGSALPTCTMKRRASSSTSSKKKRNLAYTLAAVVVATVFFLVDPSCSWVTPELIMDWILSLYPSVPHIVRPLFQTMLEIWNGRDRCAPLGGTAVENPSPSSSAQQTETPGGVQISKMDRRLLDLNEPPAPASSSEEYNGMSCETSSESQSGGSDPMDIPNDDLRNPAAPDAPMDRQGRIEMNYTPNDNPLDLEAALFKRSLTRALAEIRGQYSALPTTDDPDSHARTAVMEKLKYNLNGAFLLYLGWKKPFLPGMLPDHRGFPDYPERIEQIMNCNGKDSNSLQDLMELNLRLESKDSRERNAIMEAWRDRYALQNKSE